MVGKARALGVQFADAVWQQYQAVDPKNALDKLHESWSLLWGFPRYCMTAASASLANSVAIRCAHDSSYHPGNLTLTGCNPAATYTVVPVVPAPGAQGLRP